MRAKMYRRLGAIFAMLAVTSCANVTRTHLDWTFSVEVSGGGCITEVHYAWVNAPRPDGKVNGHKKFCGQGDFSITDDLPPTGPLDVEWTNSAAEHIKQTIDMTKVLRDRRLGGERLNLVLTEHSAQVWMTDSRPLPGGPAGFVHVENKQIY